MAEDTDVEMDARQTVIAIATEDAEEMESRRVPPAVIAAGVGAAVVGLGLLGWLIYRNRRRRNVIQQLRSTLPVRMSDLRERGAERLGDLRHLGAERIGDARMLRDEVRRRLKKAL